MKFSIVKHFAAGLAGLAIFAFASPLHAAPSITGTIEFVGGANLNGPLGSGTDAPFSLFTFNPSPGSSFTLWSFSTGGISYSFDATSVVVSAQNANFLDLEGAGVAHVTGYADTQGTWSITLTGAGPTFTFGEQMTIVPEPSSIALILVASGSLAIFWRAHARRQNALKSCASVAANCARTIERASS